MKIIFRLIAIGVLGVLGYWAWTVLHPSPEEIIRKNLLQVARSASFAANKGNIARLADAQKLGGFFASDANVTLDVPGAAQHTFEGRDEIVQAAFSVQKALSAVDIHFVGLVLALAPDKKSAEVELTAKINAPGEKSFFPQELKFLLKVIDGHWLITHVETVRVLK